MSRGWQIFQDIMVGVACGSQPGLQGLPMLVVYEQQKKQLAQLEQINQAAQQPVIQNALPAEQIPVVYPEEEIPVVYPVEE